MPKLLDQGLLSPVSPQRLGQPCQPKTGSCACDLHSNENKKAQLGQPGQSTHVESIPEYKVQITNIQTKTPRKKNRCNFTLPSLPIQASHRRRQREPLRACFKNQITILVRGQPGPSWGVFLPAHSSDPLAPSAPQRAVAFCQGPLLNLSPAVHYRTVHGKDVTNCSHAPMRHPSSCIGLSVRCRMGVGLPKSCPAGRGDGQAAAQLV